MPAPSYQNWPRCSATSHSTGEQCKNTCVPGKRVCRFHGGLSSGPPKGSKNALRTGAHETILAATMTPEEQAYLAGLDTDPLTMLREISRCSSYESCASCSGFSGRGRRKRWPDSPPGNRIRKEINGGIPPALEHLWAWFWQLRTANPSAGFGPAPLSFGEMDAWQRVTGNRLEPWHVDTLLAMDAAFLAAQPKKRAGGGGKT